jgi:fumarylpyruvate hydrolase
VVALSSGGADIAVKDAMACVFGYGVGVDFTRRDMQARRTAALCRPVQR